MLLRKFFVALLVLIFFCLPAPAFDLDDEFEDDGPSEVLVEKEKRQPAIDREDGRKMLRRTIERFEADITLDMQREALTRLNYYDWLWLSLGWDTDNYAEVRLADQEVIHEARMSHVRSMRYLDDKMISNGNLMAVEAKSARRELDNPDYIYQTKRYTWSSPQAEVGVLSNFRDLIVYDCRLKPDYNDPAAGEVLRLNYTQYLENFDLLWNLLSHEAVGKGSLKEMTQKIDPVLVRKTLDQDVLEHFVQLRLKLGADIVHNNPAISEEELNQAVGTIMNRLLLIRIMEDRDIEPTKILRLCMADWGGDRYVWDGIYDRAKRPYSLYEAITRLLSGRLYNKYRSPIFGKQPFDKLIISDSTLREIILQLYPADQKNKIGCPYDFSIVPLNILGTLYETFLGKRLTITDGKVMMEERPSVREAGGVFYTQDAVARFMAVQTITPLLEGKSPEEIYQMRFIDPAVGCGALTVQMYRVLREYVESYYFNNPEEISHIDSEFPDAVMVDGWPKLSPQIKVKVAKTLFGVDVDPRAIEIAAISLYIEILEGETFAVVPREQEYLIPNRSRKLDPGKFSLPDLNGNFIAGNALVGLDYQGSDYESVRPFDWTGKHRIGNILRAGGFDAVVMNPPYIGYQKMRDNMPDQLDYLKSKYTSMQKYRVDFSYGFIEKGIDLLNARGRMGVIATNSFLSLQSGDELRKMITEAGLLNQIVDFDRISVFNSAAVQTALLFLDKVPSHRITYGKLINEDSLDRFLAACQYARETSNSDYYITAMPEASFQTWIFPDPSQKKDFDVIQRQTSCLADYCSIFSGLSHGNRDVLFLELVSETSETYVVRSKVCPDPFEIEKQICRPVPPRGRLPRYSAIPYGEYIIFPYDESYQLIYERIMQKDFPKAYAYLSRYKDELSRRSVSVWYALPRPASLDKWPAPKLYVGLDYVTTIDPKGEFVLASGSYAGITSDHDQVNLWMLMGILNSDLIRNYATGLSGRFGNSTVPKILDMRQIPIPAYDQHTAPIYEQIEKTVKQIHKFRSQKPEYQESNLDQKIEELILKLYETGAKSANLALEREAS